MNENNPQFLLINKPPGWTSFDVVGYIRKGITQSIQNNTTPPLNLPLKEGETPQQPQRGDDRKRIKVGHAGTLDPFATGLLIVGVGREATKRLDEFKGMPKTYIATIQLGAVSDTYDIDGTIIPYSSPTVILSETKDPLKFEHQGILRSAQNDVETVLKNFIGRQNQIPPMFSAKKINGKRLYELARAGQTVERQPSEIEIYDIKLLEYSWPVLKIEVHCSTGTYIRSLAHDIGQKLGTGAYCSALVRTSIGEYKLADALSPEKIDFSKNI